MGLVRIPAGDYVMGSTAADLALDPEGLSEQTVFVEDFWLDRTEVTNAMFAAFVAATGHQTDAERNGQGMIWNSATKAWAVVSGTDWQHPQGPASDLTSLAPLWRKPSIA